MTKKGCGPGILNTGDKDIFYHACLQHDDDYANPEVSQEEADLVFLHNMLLLAEGKPLRMFRALIYYTAVRVFGRVFKRGK